MTKLREIVMPDDHEVSETPIEEQVITAQIGLAMMRHLLKCEGEEKPRFVKSAALEPDAISLRPKTRGHCYTPKGDGSLVPVYKCMSCGYSIRREP